MTSYDVVRHFKKNLPSGFGKIGHFGTLDPFACGTLMIGISGAARLNDLIHEFLPKTYLAVGKLGLETPTGDYTSEIIQKDDSLYLRREIAGFEVSFIEEKIREKFLGDYWQSPHKYSASKFMGKNLHEWARDGVEIVKPPVLRKIYRIEVVKYQFPYLAIRVEVSSGTYIRSLFSDICHYLGTIGSLISLVRESVGGVTIKDSLQKKQWPQDKAADIISSAKNIKNVLPFGSFFLDEKHALSFKNGAFVNPTRCNFQEGQIFSDRYYWIFDQGGNLLGLGEKTLPHELKPKINFHLENQSDF